MNKEEFIKSYRCPKILLGAFREDILLLRNDIEIVERQINISDFSNFCCPWYYLDNQEKTFDEGVEDPEVRAMMISDNQLVDLKIERRETVDIYREKDIPQLFPIPIATDTRTGKTLILDSNKTCVSLYRNFIDDNAEIVTIPVVEIRAPGLESVIGDFLIVNRT